MTSWTTKCRKIYSVITCAKFQNEMFTVYDFTVIEFSIFLLIFEWTLQQCSATKCRNRNKTVKFDSFMMSPLCLNIHDCQSLLLECWCRQMLAAASTRIIMSLFMVALWNRADHYIFMLWFLSSSSIFFFPRLISAAAHWMSTILPHMVWP